MTACADPEYDEYRAAWIAAGRPLPLEVSSNHDNPEPGMRLWEVLWHERVWDGYGGCDSPIAGFTTWEEAQEWAALAASTSTLMLPARGQQIIGPMPRPWDHKEPCTCTPFENPAGGIYVEHLLEPDPDCLLHFPRQARPNQD